MYTAWVDDIIKALEVFKKKVPDCGYVDVKINANGDILLTNEPYRWLVKCSDYKVYKYKGDFHKDWKVSHWVEVE